MNSKAFTSKLKRWGECWTLPGSSAPIYGVLGRDSSKLDLPLDTTINTGDIIQRNIDGSVWLCKDTCNHGGLHLEAKIERCTHLAPIFRHLPVSKDTFGRTETTLQPVLEGVPLCLVSRTMTPDMGKDRSKLTWQATFETSTVFDIHPADELHSATSEFRILSAVELTPGVLTLAVLGL